MKKHYILFILFLFCWGCASVQEPFKVIWGSSTKALEDERATATVKMYECFPRACFDKIIEVAKRYKYEIFIQEPKRNRIVIITTAASLKKEGPAQEAQGLAPQTIANTTEIGIFIAPLKIKEVRVEVVSLSTEAQAVFASRVFEELDKAFPQIVEMPL